MCGKKATKFQIGDQVKILGTHLPLEIPVGTIGTVTEIYKTGGYRVAKSGGAKGFIYFEDELEAFETPLAVPVESHKRPEVGDTIELLRDYAGGIRHPFRKGSRMVLEHDETGVRNHDFVAHADGHTLWFGADQWGEVYTVVVNPLTPIGAPKASPSGFATGSTVEVLLSRGAFDAQKVVKAQVVDVEEHAYSPDSRYKLALDGGGFVWAYEQNIRKA